MSRGVTEEKARGVLESQVPSPRPKVLRPVNPAGPWQRSRRMWSRRPEHDAARRQRQLCDRNHGHPRGTGPRASTRAAEPKPWSLSER